MRLIMQIDFSNINTMDNRETSMKIRTCQIPIVMRYFPRTMHDATSN